MCQTSAGKMTTLRGTLSLQQVAGGQSRLILKSDGKSIAVQDSPEVVKLKKSGCLDGAVAEATGLLRSDGDAPTLLIQKLSLLNGTKPNVVISVAYPVRTRCQHCGCRMEVDNAEQADSICTMCKCGKKCSECMK